MTFLDTITLVVQSVRTKETTEAYCARVYGKGVSGYIYQTVPAVIHAWLTHPLNVKQAVQAIVACGGDTDTTGSIVGGIVGASPNVVADSSLTKKLILWPRNLAYVEKLLTATEKPKIQAWQYLCRNAWFNVVVLIHALGRLLPPYKARKPARISQKEQNLRIYIMAAPFVWGLFLAIALPAHEQLPEWEDDLVFLSIILVFFSCGVSFVFLNLRQFYREKGIR